MKAAPTLRALPVQSRRMNPTAVEELHSDPLKLEFDNFKREEVSPHKMN